MAVCNLTSNMFYLTGYAAARLESLTWVLFGLVAARAGASVRCGHGGDWLPRGFAERD
jgi:hypothetical protein